MSFCVTINTKKKEMTTSVAMCTYNGEKFLKEQLDSILNQSLPIDEIVICDDGSTDETIAIIQDYSTANPDKIRLFRNNPALGVCANFARAISLCTKDIIFLADQDDIWKRDKVKTITDYFDAHPSISVVFTNAILIDEKNRKFTHLSLFDVVGINEQMHYFEKGFAMEIFLQENRASGCTMALRKKFVPNVEINEKAELHTSEQIHDGNIAMSGIVYNALGCITEPLMYYRQHTSQQYGLMSWIKNPLHLPSPAKQIGECNMGYQIFRTHTLLRVEMQKLRHDYIYNTGVLIHAIQYYKVYGELMWTVMYMDLKRRRNYLKRKLLGRKV